MTTATVERRGKRVKAPKPTAPLPPKERDRGDEPEHPLLFPEALAHPEAVLPPGVEWPPEGT